MPPAPCLPSFPRAGGGLARHDRVESAVAGDILAFASSAVDFSSSTLEVIDVTSGVVLNSFPGAVATLGAPSIGHGLLVWTDANGHATALGAKNYRP